MVIALEQGHSGSSSVFQWSARVRAAVRHFLQQFGRKTTKFTASDKGNKINSPRQKLDT